MIVYNVVFGFNRTTLIMTKPKTDTSRETRIEDEIIVDCYGEAERAMRWYYYLEDRLEFPFTSLEKATVSVSSPAL